MVIRTEEGKGNGIVEDWRILLVSHPDAYNEQISLWYYFGTKSSSKRKYRVEKRRKINKFA